jgi:hypothetical protein
MAQRKQKSLQSTPFHVQLAAVNLHAVPPTQSMRHGMRISCSQCCMPDQLARLFSQELWASTGYVERDVASNIAA